MVAGLEAYRKKFNEQFEKDSQKLVAAMDADLAKLREPVKEIQL